VHVKVDVRSIARVDSLQVIVNGRRVKTIARTGADSAGIAFDGQVEVPQGGWVAARVIGPPSKYLGDDYAFAHTGPVYIVRGGKAPRRAQDVEFLSQTVDAIWSRVDRGRWRSQAERDQFRATVDSARSVYRGLPRRRRRLATATATRRSPSETAIAGQQMRGVELVVPPSSYRCIEPVLIRRGRPGRDRDFFRRSPEPPRRRPSGRCAGDERAGR
jgi:hypothetical protein